MNFRFKNACGSANSKLGTFVCSFVCVTVIGTLFCSLATGQVINNLSDNPGTTYQNSLYGTVAPQHGWSTNQLPGIQASYVPQGDTESVEPQNAAAACNGCCSQAPGCKKCCLGNAAKRDRLFGDVFGPKSKLAERGIVTDFVLGQYYQGVTTGGNEQTSKYGGKVDMYFTFLGEKFGVNKGFNISMHAETRFGEDILGAAGPLTLPNAPLLWPLPGDYHGTNITGLTATQSLFDGKVTALFGKLNSLDLVDGFFPEVGGGRDGFLNVNGLVTALPWFRYINLSEWGGGYFVANDEGQLQNGLLIFGEDNVTTTWDFSPSFDQGLGFFGFYKFFWERAEKPGYLLVAAGGSTRDYRRLDPVDWVDVPGNGPVDPATGNTWDVAAYISQVLWQDPCNKDRRIHFVTAGTIADDIVAVSNWNAMGRIEGYGLNPSRLGDRMGFSGWYNGITPDVINLAALTGENVRDNWGMEMYYNREITPWFHLTSDMQILQNSNADTDTSLVLGLRAIIDL